MPGAAEAAKRGSTAVAEDAESNDENKGRKIRSLEEMYACEQGGQSAGSSTRFAAGTTPPSPPTRLSTTNPRPPTMKKLRTSWPPPAPPLVRGRVVPPPPPPPPLVRGRVLPPPPPPQLPPLRGRVVPSPPPTSQCGLRKIPPPLPSQSPLQPQPSPPPLLPSQRQQPPPTPDLRAGEAAVGHRLMVFPPDEGRGDTSNPRHITDRA